MSSLKSKFYKYRKFFPKISFDGLFGMFSYDCGIDLGTANTLVWVQDKGIVIREPSVVARNKKTKEVLAIGSSAKKMIGRAPKTIEIVRPLRDGVIADFDATSSMISFYIKKVHESGGVIPKVPKPRVVLAIPSHVTEVEKRAVVDAAIAAGAREVHLIEESMASAIGSGLPVLEAQGNLIIDIGGGTTEIGVISLGGVVTGRSIRTAGDALTDSIMQYVRLKYSLLVGSESAESVKHAIGSAIKKDEDEYFTIRGRDLETGLPKAVSLSSTEVTEAMKPHITQLIKNIVEVVEDTPPELISDIMERGIVLAGGGALLQGFAELVSEKSKMPVTVSDDALTSVVRGCGKVLEDPLLLSKIQVTTGTIEGE